MPAAHELAWARAEGAIQTGPTMKLAEQLERILENRIAQDNLTLPLLPAISAKVNEAIRRPEATAKELMNIVELDPILAAVVMRHGTAAGCKTFDQVIGKFGLQKLRLIMADASTHRVMESRDQKSADATRLLWDHSRAVAIMAQNVGILIGVEEPDVCYVAGLLHDVGKPIVATILLEAENQIAQRNPKLWIDGDTWVGVVERTHRKIGIELAKKWQFSEDVQNAVQPFTDYDVGNRQSIGNAVHFANALAKQMGIYVQGSTTDDHDAMVMVGSSLLGLDEDGIARVTTDIKTRCRLG
jgi:putative nucleotidyltransferase with HDIG domain